MHFRTFYKVLIYSSLEKALGIYLNKHLRKQKMYVQV